jgi:uncharacterized protein YuzE
MVLSRLISGRAYLRAVTLADKLTIHNAFGPEISPMRRDCYPDKDSLYIDFSSRPSVESEEVAPGVVLDCDAEGNLVGIDIDQASRKLGSRQLVTSQIPLGANAEP